MSALRLGALAAALLALAGCRDAVDLGESDAAAPSPPPAAPAAADTPEPGPEEDGPPPEPATEEACRAAFEHLVGLQVRRSQRRWQDLGRAWDQEARREAEATARDGEARAVAHCLRHMTASQARCQQQARTPTAWRRCASRR